jgi:ABC-2 type transport system ATP-binding protein
MAETVLVVDKLTKDYRTDFFKKKVRAVTDVSLEVTRGELFGFIGPNGAGKTTTIRTAMGLIRPTRGRVTIFGHAAGTREARQRVGFLPESPYFYDYLNARELLDLCGRLFDMPAPERRARADVLLERVGLTAAADRPLRKFSKGMLQRAGLAQALMHDPELVVLDEPMSGLDPLGRREVRDIMLELRQAGKTIFFSTHILPDVEALCDRVAVIHQGRVQEVGPVVALVDRTHDGTDVVLRTTETLAIPDGAIQRRIGDEVTVGLPPDFDVTAFLATLDGKARVMSVTPRRESLEDWFVRLTREEGQP